MTNLDSIGAPALASQRHLFDIPDEVAFLNCAYISPLPKASLMAGEQGLRRKSRPWTIAPADFFVLSETVRKLFADLVNARADDIAFTAAVSYGMAQAAHNVQIKKTQRIVTLSEQFPSNVYPWMDLAERTGAAFVSVPRPDDDDWTSALLSFIDRSTGIVAVPHCHWTDGGLIDLEAIGAACRRVGAVLCVDATQSVGALPPRCQTRRSGFSRRGQLQMAARAVQSWVSVRCAALARRSSHRAQLDCTQGLRKFRRSRELQR
jgi:selenocysteine lyase/cysteine desulfurase